MNSQNDNHAVAYLIRLIEILIFCGIIYNKNTLKTLFPTRSGDEEYFGYITSKLAYLSNSLYNVYPKNSFFKSSNGHLKSLDWGCRRL